MTIKVALDSAVLVYAEGVNGQDCNVVAGGILKEFTEEQIILPA